MKNQATVVRILVKAEDGHFLLVRRSEGDRWSPHKYELPGGKVDFQEEFEEAAKRELREETGLENASLTFLHAFSEEFHGTLYTILAYTAEVGYKKPITLSDEHDALLWTTQEGLRQLEVTGHTNEIVDVALQASSTSVNNELNNYDVKKSSNLTEVVIYTDGGSRGNPGPSASGYAILDKEESVLEEGGEYLGITTNSQAEYQAVKLALEQAAKYHPQRITFCIDSEMVVGEMNGRYQIKNRDLWPIYARIKELMGQFKSVHFVHVGRELNRLADAKVNEILDSHMRKA
jgi:ribonuclease HI/8-oxo-dGTP pyrophosphatase MutT (NUDIX family)